MAITFLSDGAAGHGLTPTAANSVFNGPKSGTVDVTTSVKEHGYGSLQHDSGAGASAYVNRLACLQDSGTRISIRFRFGGFPSGTNTGIIRILNSGTTQLAELRVDNAGKLRLAAGTSGSTLQATGTTVLSTGTFYRISLCYTITSSSVNEWRVYIDGALELSVSNVTSQGTGTTNLRIGWTGTSPGANVLMYTQDFYVDNDSSLADPGNVRVTGKMPAAAGSSNAFDTAVGSGTNRWDRVNERPASTANRYTQAGTSQVIENYTVQAASVGDDDLTGVNILGWAPWVYWAIVASAGSTLVSMIANGSVIGLTSTSGSNVYQSMESIVASTSYPSGNDAVGLRSSGTAADVHLAECGVFIAYTPASGTSLESPTAAITLAAQTPSAVAAATAASPLASIALAALTPSASAAVSATSPVAALTLTAQTPSFTAAAQYTSPVAAITLAALTPSASAVVSVTSPVAALTLAALTPSVSVGVSYQSPLAGITLGVLTPTFAAGVAFTSPVAALTLAPQTPAFTVAAILTSPLGSIALVPLTPSAAAAVSYQSPVAAIALTPRTPSFAAGVAFTSPLAAITLAALTPSIGVGVAYVSPLGSITLTPLTPAFSAAVQVTSPVAALTLAPLTPAALAGVAYTSPVAALILAGLTPSFGEAATVFNPLPHLTGTITQVFTQGAITAGQVSGGIAQPVITGSINSSSIEGDIA